MTNKIQTLFFLSVLGLVIGLTILVFWPYAGSLLLAGLFAVALYPIYEWVLKMCNGWSKTASVLSVVIILLVVLLPLIFLGYLMFLEAQNVYSWLTLQGGQISFMSKSLIAIQDKINLISPDIKLNWDFGAYAETGLNWLVGHFSSFFSSTMGILMNLILMIMAIFYMFANGKEILKIFKKISPLDDLLDEKIFSRISQAINSVVRGYFLMALLQGLLSSLGLYIFGVSNPLLWGAAAAIASFVPVFGTALVFIPAIIFLFVSGNLGGTIGLAVWGFLLVSLVDNVVMPLIIRRGLAINPFLILLSVLGGMSFFGTLGIFIGPLALSLLIVLLEFYPLIIKKNVSKDC